MLGFSTHYIHSGNQLQSSYITFAPPVYLEILKVLKEFENFPLHIRQDCEVISCLSGGFCKVKNIFCFVKTGCALFVVVPFFLPNPGSLLNLCNFRHLADRFQQWLMVTYLKCVFFSTRPALTLYYCSTVIQFPAGCWHLCVSYLVEMERLSYCGPWCNSWAIFLQNLCLYLEHFACKLSVCTEFSLLVFFRQVVFVNFY